ncbi:MAG: outer membrane protein assembly factor BamE [Spirochaetaceae bacterium]|nr:outer membrane protein assembly factor BamE [Spirochaetaceae bacterium]
MNIKIIVLWTIIILSLIFMSFLTYAFFHVETDCPWNRYIDTKFSVGLNTDNIEIVNEINIGMSKFEVIGILGNPLFITKLYDKNKEWYNYTSDRAAPYGWDFSWFEVRINFENDIVIEKEIGWVYD